MVPVACQALAKCEVSYTKDQAMTLTDNWRIKYILEVSDPKTAKTVQYWCGTYRDKKETLNGGKDQHKSYSYENQPIVEPKDLLTLTKKQEVILVISGTGYLRVKKVFYFKDKILSVMAEKLRQYN